MSFEYDGDLGHGPPEVGRGQSEDRASEFAREVAGAGWSGIDLFGLAEPEGELAWQERALCAQTDPESFFPEKGGSTREAKRVCTTCEVKAECLEYALKHDERFGIWGGLSERERRKFRRAG